ncbi:MAG: adenylate/guanylate cyclase domain-containing protein [Halioglobus sp.]|nr:adenylate/guanylate cyclase domain-containing protein [Halioglobus sp.]
MQYLSKNRYRIVLGIGITLLALWMQLFGAGPVRTVIDRLDAMAYDLRLNLTLDTTPLARAPVVIVDIDAASLRSEGRWPWSRATMGELVVAMERAGALTIGFDVVFAEAERNVAEELIDAAAASGQLAHREYLQTLIPTMDRDQDFASLLEHQDTVLGFLFHARAGAVSGELPSPWLFIPEGQRDSLTVPTMKSYTGNLRILQKAARHGGFLNTTKDSDGVLRSTPLILAHNGVIYPSLSLAMARRFTNSLRFQLATAKAGRSDRVTALLLDRIQIPTDKYGRVLIPYSGKRGRVTYISATELLQSSNPAKDFPDLNNAAVLVGTSALGLSDVVSTPVDPAFPGVEVHATVLQTILSGAQFPRVPDWANAANALAIAVSGLLLSLLCPVFGALTITLSAVFFVGVVIGGDIWLWRNTQLSLSPIMPLFTVITIISLNVIMGYFTEAKQKRQVRKAFSAFMAPALVDQLVANPETLSLTGESREMTFLFSDIAGFTTFTESASPELLVSTLNEYLDAMCRAVIEQGGTIDKIVGDAVIGIFNAPIDQSDHAQRAVACALEMSRISNEFIAKMNVRGFEFGFTRIGINTGRAIVGNFGGSERFDYTAHGDAINTAARLESVNRHLGTQICIAGTTVAHCPNHFFRPIGALVLKGKSEAIDAFEPITPEEADSAMNKSYLDAFACLARGEAKAVKLFKELLANYPEDALVTLHCDRIKAGNMSTTIVLKEK